MAFQTKANPSKKQKTAMGKKSFDNSRDDAGNGEMVKSPGGKTPKSKQSLGDRKFSLQVPGKNTPGKNQRDSFSGKKQLTSGNKGKTAIKAFQGMKTNGKRKAQDSDDDDGDDKDEEYDDLGDDDEEEEEERNIKTGAQNKTKTPVKTEKTPQASENTPPKGGENMNSEPQNISIDVMKSFKLTWDQRRKKCSRMLCIKRLPLDVEEAELKALSSDILDVILPGARRPLEKRKRRRSEERRTFLLFANESKVEENFKMLQKKKIRNSDFILNFHCEKSQKLVDFAIRSPEVIAKIWNIQQLYITDLPMGTTINQVAYLFPKACHICMKISTNFRAVEVLFDTAEMAAKAVQTNQDAEISGQKISIMYHYREKKKSKIRKHPNLQ